MVCALQIYLLAPFPVLMLGETAEEAEHASYTSLSKLAEVGVRGKNSQELC